MSIATSTPPTESIVKLLKDPTTYAERPDDVEMIETHISWVFLTGHFAYKLKKPVQFEFLDFSTPHARRRACAEEIRLNQRLSHQVYISMLPITFDEHAGLELDGSGHPIDYVVKMRRLPEDRALDQLIVTGRLRPSDIDAVSRYLVEYYSHLPPKILNSPSHHQHLVSHCRANLADMLEQMDSSYDSQLRRIHGNQHRYLTLHKQLFFDRVCDGRIIDGHGDLRAEHVYVESHPAVIDCVEFSSELREVDVLDELCFLAMDCERLGNSEVGHRVLQAYISSSGDHPPDSLVYFYKSYRACVRAKVSALRAAQANKRASETFLRQSHEYLVWADHYAAQLGAPVAVIVSGVMGSGKSTLASEVAKAIGGELIQTDRIRRSILGRSKTPADYGAGPYHPNLRRQVYDTLFQRADEMLREGRSVVLDGTFLTNDLRQAVVNQVKLRGAQPLLVECRCPRRVALSRIDARAEIGVTDSEARPELYDRQLAEYEPFDTNLPSIEIDTTGSINQELQPVFDDLRPRLFD